MTRPTVVVAERIAAAGMEALAAQCTVADLVGADRPALLAALADATGLIVRSATRVDAEVFAAAPRLEVVGRAGIGVDNIDIDAATAAGVLVVNAPQANTVSAAEHTMALLLAQARRIPEADASMRRGEWARTRFEGVELHGKRLGILGLGKIGTLVAQRASAFGMQVLAYDPYVGAERARRLGVELADLDRVLAESDFLTIHLPRTTETVGLLDSRALDRVKPGIRIINVSRGGIVDEDALAAALASGRVAGAALDVFAEEPPGPGPLQEMPGVVLTPHLGASTREAQDKAGIDVAEAVVQALRGELVMSAVNVDLGPGLSEEVKPYLAVAEILGELFTGFAAGLPESLVVRAEGKLADEPIRPLVLAALKGALSRVSGGPVSYVNAPMLAQGRGIEVSEERASVSPDYQSVLRLSGTVDGKPVMLAAVAMGHKGPVLVEVNGYEIELPLTRWVLLVRNDDVPGVIGRLGTYLGEEQVNIADMVVGRATSGEAMMGLSLDQPLTPDQVAAVRALHGIADARFVELG